MCVSISLLSPSNNGRMASVGASTSDGVAPAPPGIRRSSLLSLLRARIEAESIWLADDIHAAKAALLEAGAHCLIADAALSQAVVLDLLRTVRQAGANRPFCCTARWKRRGRDTARRRRSKGAPPRGLLLDEGYSTPRSPPAGGVTGDRVAGGDPCTRHGLLTISVTCHPSSPRNWAHAPSMPSSVTP